MVHATSIKGFKHKNTVLLFSDTEEMLCYAEKKETTARDISCTQICCKSKYVTDEQTTFTAIRAKEFDFSRDVFPPTYKYVAYGVRKKK